MTIFFTADLHLQHKNVLHYDHNRDHETIDEHDEYLIKQWNSTITKRDEVYILGDIGMSPSISLFEKIGSLNGKKTLVRGNHDLKLGKKRLKDSFCEIVDIKYMRIDGQKIILCHYPMETWASRNHGAIHLHGHSHGRLPFKNNRLDVGIMNNIQFRPLSWFEALTTLQAMNALAEQYEG